MDAIFVFEMSSKTELSGVSSRQSHSIKSGSGTDGRRIIYRHRHIRRHEILKHSPIHEVGRKINAQRPAERAGDVERKSSVQPLWLRQGDGWICNRHTRVCTHGEIKAWNVV